MERIVTFDAGQEIPETAEESWSLHALSPGGRSGQAVLRRHVAYGRAALFTEEFRFGMDELRMLVPESDLGPGPGREGSRP